MDDAFEFFLADVDFCVANVDEDASGAELSVVEGGFWERIGT